MNGFILLIQYYKESCILKASYRLIACYIQLIQMRKLAEVTLVNFHLV